MQANRVLPLARVAALGTVSVFSLIVLALGAHILNTVGIFYSPLYYFASLGVATSVLSLLTLPAMYIFAFDDKDLLDDLFCCRLGIGEVRKGAFPSFIVVELGWSAFLWVLWLATGSRTASINFTGGNCGLGDSEISTFCSEVNALEAFAFLSWIILLSYYIMLLAFSFQAYQRGNTSVWYGTVKDTDFDTIHHPEKPYGAGISTHQYPPVMTGMVATPYNNIGLPQV